MARRRARASCPRCGDDLSELVDSWTDSCPVAHVCTECGLRFAWREAFESAPGWWVEHRGGVVRAAWTALIAPILALAPWAIWRRLPMAMPLRVGRLFLPYVVVGFGVVLWVESSIVPPAIQAVRAVLGPSMSGQDMLAVALRAAGCGLFDPIAELPQAQVASASKWSWSQATPFFGTSDAGDSGTYFDVGGQTWVGRTSGTAVLRSRGAWKPFAIIGFALVLPFTALTASVVAFAFLPIARRRAMVRWAHLVRAGLVIGWTAAGVVVLAAQLYPVAMRLRTTEWELFLIGAPTFLAAWLWYEWHPIVARYLRMERATLVVASVSIIGGLSAAALFTAFV